MDLFLREAADRIGEEDGLARIDALLAWRLFSPILNRGLGRSGIGPQGYDQSPGFVQVPADRTVAWFERPEAGTCVEGAP